MAPAKFGVRGEGGAGRPGDSGEEEEEEEEEVELVGEEEATGGGDECTLIPSNADRSDAGW